MKTFVFRAEEIREIDAYSASVGLTSAVLMSNFAIAIADAAEAFLSTPKRRVLVLAGSGNNGGDGIAAARIMARRGVRVDLAAPLGVKSETARIFYALASADGLREVDAETVDFDGYDLLVDALLGIGLDREIEGKLYSIIQRTNASLTPKLSVDVPSGLDGRGFVRGIAVKADRTITACGYKYALLFGEGQNYAGEIQIVDIGAAYPRDDYAEYVAETTLPKRAKVSHKGDYANVFLIGGTQAYPGAGYLVQTAARAALRSGAGRARLVVADCDRVYFTNIREEMIATLPSENGEMKFEASALDALIPDGAIVVLGCGGGANAALGLIAEHLIARPITLILDADGINMFRAYERLASARARVMFTPHVKEFSRMTGLSVAQILADPVAHAHDFARKHACSVLLKSNFTIATDGVKVYVTAEGTPAQAKGGSGDALAGVIAALCVNFAPIEAGIRASVILGHAARATERDLAECAILASDSLKHIK